MKDDIEKAINLSYKMNNASMATVREMLNSELCSKAIFGRFGVFFGFFFPFVFWGYQK